MSQKQSVARCPNCNHPLIISAQAQAGAAGLPWITMQHAAPVPPSWHRLLPARRLQRLSKGAESLSWRDASFPPCR